ncbi:MAG: signal peptide peptidase SppA [Deltaproteobacteria bacterium]|nr:signal peptide peptidase SppA [Deltaproteobacteria bacterium]
MPARTRIPRLALTMLPLLLAAPQAFAQESRRPITAGIRQPFSSALLADDGTALTLNPATIGFSGGLQLIYSHENSLGGWGLESDGGYLSYGGLGVLGLAGSIESIKQTPDCTYAGPCLRRGSFGLSLRAEQFSLGISAHRVTSDQRADIDVSSTDLGAVWRPFECAAIGFAALDVNAPSVGGNPLPRRFLGSIAARPICDRVTVTADAEWASCTGTNAFEFANTPRSCGIDKPDMRFTADATVFDGLKILGQVAYSSNDERWSGQIGLAVETGHLGIAASRSLNEASGQRFGLRVRLSSDQFKTRLAGGPKVVMLDLDKALTKPRTNFLALVMQEAPEDPLRLTLDLLNRIGESSTDALVIRSSNFPLHAGQAEELRNGIEGLRAKGKKVVFYLENATNLDYYVATAADRIYAAPQAVLAVNGFSATSFFLAAGLDKLGVKAEFFRVGAYKNAPDMFTRSEMSSEQREATTALLDDVTARFDRAVKERRKIEGAKWKALLDQGLIQPQKAVEGGLIDGLAWPDQLEDEVGTMLGAGGKVKLSKITTERPKVRDDRWGERDQIGIVRVEGNILPGDGSAGAGRVTRRIRKLADDPRVKAIVVRIDSPGGDGNSSDLIWRELVRARKEKGKPVVASMGDVAASGGYYVAVGADAIFAEPTTITGSIGVFAGHYDVSSLLGKIGVNTVTIRKNDSSDMMGFFRPLSDTERTNLQAWVDQFYETFLSRVAEGRKLKRDTVHAVAQGRVWSGVRALDKGLVDKLGGLDDAIADARKRAAIHESEDVDIDEDLQDLDGLLDSPFGGLSVAIQKATGASQESSMALAKAALVNTPLAPVVDEADRTLEALGASGSLRARMDVDVDVH